MNNVSLVGRLAKDIDLRYTSNGKAVANSTLAVNRPFKNQNGEHEADFILFQIWGKAAENLANYMKKGSQIGITGRIQTRNYENNQGQRVYVTEVVADSIQFLESKGSQQQGQNYQQQPNQQYNQQSHSQQQINAANQEVNRQADPFQGQGQPIDIDDSSLPF